MLKKAFQCWSFTKTLINAYLTSGCIYIDILQFGFNTRHSTKSILSQVLQYLFLMVNLCSSAVLYNLICWLPLTLWTTFCSPAPNCLLVSKALPFSGLNPTNREGCFLYFQPLHLQNKIHDQCCTSGLHIGSNTFFSLQMLSLGSIFNKHNMLCFPDNLQICFPLRFDG